MGLGLGKQTIFKQHFTFSRFYSKKSTITFFFKKCTYVHSFVVQVFE